MILFASDLDNTLIFSERRDLQGEKKCIEVYQGRNISYMTLDSISYLKQLQELVRFVPVTTRSLDGFLRIDFSDVGVPKYAVVCNGGILLEDGKVNEVWYSDSLHMIAESIPVLNQAMELLERDENRSFEVRKPNDLFVFTKSNSPELTVNLLEKTLDLSVVDVLSQKDKIYVMPKKLHKGTAVERLKNFFSPEKTIVAGDTIFDVPMLRLGELAYFPEELKAMAEEIPNGCCIAKEYGNFSDILLKCVLEFVEI
ncbi:MAG: HAD hydrolase family protein [Bacillota bacterium]